MARKNTSQNGHTRLEEALATLIQNQAAFVARLSESEQQRLENERHYLEFERRHLEYQRETAERFARIEAQMAEIIRVLNEHGRILTEHGRILERLTEAVREKIGFKDNHESERRPDGVEISASFPNTPDDQQRAPAQCATFPTR